MQPQIAPLRSPADAGSRMPGWASVLAAILLLYVASPALGAQHLEGYTVTLQSLALAMSGGWMDRQDLAIPAVSQFYFVVRPGIVELLALMNKIRGGSSDFNFHVLTVAGLIGLVVGSCVFARRWGNVSTTAVLLIFAIIPGALTLGYYFNDNVVSSGFVALALAAIGPRSRPWLFAVAGGLIGAAVLCRIDALLALPFFPLMAFAQRRTMNHLILAMAWFVAPLLIVLAAHAALTGVTVFDSIIITERFKPTRTWASGLKAGVFFFDLIAPVLIIVGAAPFVRAAVTRNERTFRDSEFWARFTLLVIFPLCILAFALAAASIKRYFFPLLLPVIALHGARGLERTISAYREGSRAAIGGVLIGLILLVGPPIKVNGHDGPEQLGGTIWSPPLWRIWQSAQASSLALTDRLVSELGQQQRSLLITSSFNDEFYMRLRLQEHGWRDVPTRTAFPGCSGFSTYARGTQRIMHVREQTQFFLSPLPWDVLAALLLVSTDRCPVTRAVSTVILTSFGTGSQTRLGNPVFGDDHFHHLMVPATPTTGPYRLQAILTRRGHEAVTPVMDATRLSPAELAAAVDWAQAKLAASGAGTPSAQAALVQKYEVSYRAAPVGFHR
jgi:hypothetical protein